MTIADQSVSRTNELNQDGEARIYRSLRHFWHAVAHSEDLTDKPIAYTLLGQEIVITRFEDGVAAFDDLCAHRGTKLSLGKVFDGKQLECPYHGWRYNSSGTCVLAPQRPDLAANLRAQVKKYLAVEKFGLVWVCLVDEPHFPLPEFPQWGDPQFEKTKIPSTIWQASSARRIENFCDFAHLHIVHEGILGDRDHPEIPAHDVYRDGNRLMCTLKEGETFWAGVTEDGEAEERFDTQHHTFMPLTTIFEMIFSGGDAYYVMLHPTPIGPKTIENFVVAVVKFNDPEEAKRFPEEVAVIHEQDRPVVESQRPEELPEDLSEEMHLKAVDTYSVEYRRWLLQLANELVTGS